MKEFGYYLQTSDVKRCTKNIALAKSLVIDMKTRLSENWDEDINKKPKTIFENVYDSLRDFCDALLALEGFKSYSHEASIAFLLKKGFDIATVSKFDNLRYMRNGSKYYGRQITPEDAKNIKDFYNQLKEKIDNIVKQNKLNV